MSLFEGRRVELGPADKRLFTPGPLTTSEGVRKAMNRDLGSRDEAFIGVVAGIRRQLLAIAGVNQEQGYEAIPMQGSGTYAVESVISSVVPREGKLLVIVNGAYGERIVEMAKRLNIRHEALRWGEDAAPEAEVIERRLADDQGISHVAVVHCETTTGLINPVEEVARAVKRQGRSLVVDGMSSFGALPCPVKAWGIDYLVSSANKCLEGVPGVAFVIGRRESLAATEGNARTLSLDLWSQWRGLEENGQFRFTPPTHVLLGLEQALKELEEEGGVTARGQRYATNQRVLMEGMGRLGFRAYLPAALQGPIITSFHYPADERFHFDRFYRLLSEKGMLIYPGKLSRVNCFRIGTIGHLFEEDILSLLEAIEATLKEMEMSLPVG